MSDIKIASPYGDARKQAEDANAVPGMRDSGLTAEQAAESRRRFDAWEGRLVSRSSGSQGPSMDRKAEILGPELQKMGANLLPNRIATARKTANFGGMPSGLGFGTGTGTYQGNGATGQYAQAPRPYQPEFDSPDRLSYPVHRILANRYWRLFHKLDPHVGTGIDILSELWVSEFQLSGEGVDGSIKRDFESMVEETELLAIQPHMAREYWVTGEMVPHCIFDESKGYWVHLALHNPDQLEVVDAPFLHMDPVIEFVPDDRLRQIVSSSDPALLEVRNSLPGELVARIQSGQNIPLDSVNTTFLARKLHHYDTRGTSLMSRLWRVFMYEDGVFSASIATARRHASPIKVVKMGNERTGWIPGVAAEAKMADLLARAELDVHSYLITHYGVAFEAWGTTDRTMSISRELDAIERLKLIGIGISKALVTGEVTYASAEKGLQVLMHRLKTFRHMVDSKWTIPKYFRQVSKMNDWRKISKSESRRGYRIAKKEHELNDGDYITPVLEYANPLSPRCDADMQKALEGLERLGIKISKTTKASTVAGLNFEREKVKLKEEQEQEAAEAAAKTPATAAKPKVPTPTPPAEGEQGTTVPTPTPPEGDAAGVAVPLPPESEATEGVAPPMPPEGEAPEHKASAWDQEEHVRPLVEYLIGNPEPMIDSAFWEGFHKKNHKNEKLTDSLTRWDAVEQHLEKEGYLDAEIDELHTACVRAKALHDPAKEVLDGLPEDASELSDDEFNERAAALVGKTAVKKKSEEAAVGDKKLAGDNFFTGITDPPPGTPKFSFVGKDKSTLAKWTKLQAHMGHKTHGQPRHTGPHGRFDYNVDAMPWDSPINQESRNDWQRRLDTSRLPEIVKSRIRYLENAGVDHWNAGFDRVWKALSKRLQTKMRLEPESVRELLAMELSSHVDSFQGTQGYYDAIADIYAEGKLESYKALNFADKKRKKLKTASTSKIAITVDSVGERQVLDQLADNALSKVTSTVSTDVKKKILDALTENGSYSESVMDLANKIIKEEREKLEADPSLSHQDLQERLRELYETQRFNIQRIMRTEAINAYGIATLRGFQEQGIERVKWNAHLGQTALDPGVTCNVCRSMDGMEFDVAYLLSLGQYPISTLTHPQCRCFLTPVIVFVSFEEFERDFAQTHPTVFAPTETVVNEDLAEFGEILKRIQTKLTDFQGVPSEYVAPVEEAMAAIDQAHPDYQAMMPRQVNVVKDIAAEPAFQKDVGEETAAELTDQVTNYTDSNGVGYVSGFATRDENPTSIVIRTWAENIWDKDINTRTRFTTAYDDFKAQETPENISPKSAEKLVKVLDPWAPARQVQVGPVQALTLNKKFRDLSDSDALDFLAKVGIPKKDAAKIVNWRKEYVLWDLSSGGVIESDSHPEKSPFVNDVAALDPEHMFVESMVIYSTSPTELSSRSPELYEILKSSYFTGAPKP